MMGKRKYLISRTEACRIEVPFSQNKIRAEQPTSFIVNLNLDKVPFLKPALILFAIAMAAAIFITIKTRKTNEDEEE